VRFVDKEYGDYVVHLPGRDFDVTFDPHPGFPEGMSWPVPHDRGPNTYPITGQQQVPDRPAVRIHRLGFGGDGNAHEYIPAGRSWIASEKQALEDVLGLGDGSPGVSGHLVTITEQAENEFVTSLFFRSPDLCPGETDPRRCRFKAWIGLTDDVQEGIYVWVNGEGSAGSYPFQGWPGGSPPEGKKESNRDHVEIGADGIWGTINGASSTNDGYFVEFEVPDIQNPFES
jgi:hypothetical protein